MISALQHEVKRGWLKIPDPKVLEEMESFVSTEKKPQGEAGPGAHDDLVMALAGAIYVARKQPELVPDAEKSRTAAGWGRRRINWQDLLDADTIGSSRLSQPIDVTDPAQIVPWRTHIAAQEGDQSGADLLDTFLRGMGSQG